MLEVCCPSEAGDKVRAVNAKNDGDVPAPDESIIDRLEQAAIEAEIQTGFREETVEEAKRHVLLRLGQILVGFLVVFAGLLMLPLPGPGMLTLAAGLAILAPEVPFARRLLVQVRKRLPSDAEGKVPLRIVFGGLALSVLGVCFSIWWSFIR
jgi:uncharacterized protein (TIGR02611 family)